MQSEHPLFFVFDVFYVFFALFATFALRGFEISGGEA